MNQLDFELVVNRMYDYYIMSHSKVGVHFSMFTITNNHHLMGFVLVQFSSHDIKKNAMIFSNVTINHLTDLISRTYI